MNLLGIRRPRRQTAWVRVCVTLALSSIYGFSPAGAEPAADFVGASACQGCHAQQVKAWSLSQHKEAMAEANEHSVRGDFSDVELKTASGTWRFFRDGSSYKVGLSADASERKPEMLKTGQEQQFTIRYTFGVTPLQQYLVAFKDGRAQALTVAWDSRRQVEGGQRWFDLYPDETLLPGGPLHWQGRLNTWNARCAECHSTDLKKNYDPVSDRYATRFSAINVSCEACHGPASRHLTWAAAQRGKREENATDKGLVVNFRQSNSHYLVDRCAPCHSRRHRVSPDDIAGRSLLDDFMPATLDADFYYADGQIRAEDYVYGSFLQSKMYQHGVACNDCHDSHSLQLKRSGNSLCLQCHNTSPPKRFPTLKHKNYDAPSHYFHAAGTVAAQCVTCHMPVRTYMAVDARRDHSFRIPRPDLSATLAVPNVCRSCHKHESNEWAMAFLERRSPGFRSRVPIWPGILERARSGNAESLASLLAVIGSASNPLIIRATALKLLPPYLSHPTALQAVLGYLNDPAPWLRSIAAGDLAALPLKQRQRYLTPLLGDSITAVRIEAARLLAGLPSSSFSVNDRRRLDSALAEYKGLQAELADSPEAHLNLAVLASAQGRLHEAVAEYRFSLAIAPDFSPARINLASLLNRLGRNKEAESELKTALRAAPDNGDLWYSLGLILAQENDLPEAVRALKRAVELTPLRARMFYNLGLMLARIEQPLQAEQAFKRAFALASDDPDIVYAMISFYLQRQDFENALSYARLLSKLMPGDRATKRMQQKIEARLAASPSSG